MAEIYDFSSGRKRENHNEYLDYPKSYYKERMRHWLIKWERTDCELQLLKEELNKMTIWQRIFCWKWGK